MSAGVPREGATALAWWVTWLAWSALLLQQLVDVWQSGMPWIFWLVKLVPLLMFLPGMLRDRLRSFIWLCFVSLLYFIALVERVFAVPGGLLGWSGLVAVCVLFCSGMLYVRWRARSLREFLSSEESA